MSTETRVPPRRRLMRRRSRRRLTGAVYAEAVMVMGTMIMLFFLIDFVHEGYTKAVVSATETRGAGWSRTMEPCQDNVAGPTQQNLEGSWGVGSLTSLTFAMDAVEAVTHQPLLARYYEELTFKMDQWRYTQSDSVTRPDALGGDARFGHQIVLTCDENIEDMELDGLRFGMWTQLAYEMSGI